MVTIKAYHDHPQLHTLSVWDTDLLILETAKAPSTRMRFHFVFNRFLSFSYLCRVNGSFSLKMIS